MAARFAAGNYNRPPRPGTKSVRAILITNLFSAFNIIIGLIICFLLIFYVGTHDQRLLWDCVGVFSVALFNTVIAVVQEIRAKLAMDKVNMLIVRKVTVIRDGEPQEISHDQIVLGDAIAIKRGDQVVVDGPLIQSNHLELDESLLTGESESVEKRKGELILSGSFCLSGSGLYLAERLSDRSYVSEITRTAQRLKSEPSPLQRSVNRIVKLLFGVAILLCGLQSAVSFYRHDMDVDLVARSDPDLRPVDGDAAADLLLPGGRARPGILGLDRVRSVRAHGVQAAQHPSRHHRSRPRPDHLRPP